MDAFHDLVIHIKQFVKEQIAWLNDLFTTKLNSTKQEIDISIADLENLINTKVVNVFPEVDYANMENWNTGSYIGTRTASQYGIVRCWQQRNWGYLRVNGVNSGSVSDAAQHNAYAIVAPGDVVSWRAHNASCIWFYPFKTSYHVTQPIVIDNTSASDVVTFPNYTNAGVINTNIIYQANKQTAPYNCYLLFVARGGSSEAAVNITLNIGGKDINAGLIQSESHWYKSGGGATVLPLKKGTVWYISNPTSNIGNVWWQYIPMR